MRIRRFNRPDRSSAPPSGMVWFSLGLLILALVLVLLVRDKLASSAAGCYMDLSAPEPGTAAPPSDQPAADSNVTVVPPPPK